MGIGPAKNPLFTASESPAIAHNEGAVRAEFGAFMLMIAKLRGNRGSRRNGFLFNEKEKLTPSSTPQRLPDLLRRRRHVDRLHACRAQRVEQGRYHGLRGGDAARLPRAFHAQRIGV